MKKYSRQPSAEVVIGCLRVKSSNFRNNMSNFLQGILNCIFHSISFEERQLMEISQNTEMSVSDFRRFTIIPSVYFQISRSFTLIFTLHAYTFNNIIILFWLEKKNYTKLTFRFSSG